MSRRHGTRTKLTRNPKESDRGYSLGERNPLTLPGGYALSESWSENRSRTRSWTSIRKWIGSVNSTGTKY